MGDARAHAGSAGAHRFAVRVYYEDTDLAGVVYHANYLRFMERARTEMLREGGVAQGALMAERQLGFVATRCDVAWRRPARYDDLLLVETRVLEIGGARLELDQRVLLPDGGVAAEARVQIALIRSDTGRAVRIPEDLRAQIRASGREALDGGAAAR